MIDRLDPDEHDWMTAPGARAVTAALAAARPGAEPGEVARYVGGCVRNALMGRPIDDVDVATVLTPTEAGAALRAAGLKVIPTGEAHGTLTAVASGTPYEITTLRRDVSTDGRNATVAFSQDWVEDSARRDFRLNAIYCACDGTLFDPQGGVADALAGRVVFIGAARARIREDYLRILRFFRFQAWYGREALDADGLAACAELKDGLARLSVERIWKELRKLLSAPDPRAAVAAMAETGVGGVLLPEGMALARLDELVALELGEGLDPEPMTRLLALIEVDARRAAALAARLKMSNAEAARLTAAAAPGLDPVCVAALDEEDWPMALYPHDRQAFLDRARLAWAQDDGARAQRLKALIAFASAWKRPSFPLTGADLIARGVAPGPRLGATLKALEALWVRGGFRADKTALLEALPFAAGE